MRQIPNVAALKKISDAGPNAEITPEEWDELCALALIGLSHEEVVKEMALMFAVLDV